MYKSARIKYVQKEVATRIINQQLQSMSEDIPKHLQVQRTGLQTVTVVNRKQISDRVSALHFAIYNAITSDYAVCALDNAS